MITAQQHDQFMKKFLDYLEKKFNKKDFKTVQTWAAKESNNLKHDSRIRMEFRSVRNTFAVTAESPTDEADVKENIEKMIHDNSNNECEPVDEVIKLETKFRTSSNPVYRVELKGKKIDDGSDGEIFPGAAMYKGIRDFNESKKKDKQRLFISPYTPRCARDRVNELQKLARDLRKTNPRKIFTRLKIDHKACKVTLLYRTTENKDGEEDNDDDKWTEIKDANVEKSFIDRYNTALQKKYTPYTPKAKENGKGKGK